MKTTPLLLALLVIISGCGGPVATDPNLRTELTGIVETWREKTPAPGVVVAVTGSGIGDHLITSGSLHKNDEEPVTLTTRFRVASVTKILVAVVILQLVEERRLSLEDPVAERMPQRVAGATLAPMLAGVTVRDLLAHTSGLPDSGRSPVLVESLRTEPERVWTTEEVLAVVAERKPEFTPGTAFGYSNTNYLLLGEVIEEVTGNRWWSEIRARVLDPVGMTGSYLAGFEQPTGTLAPGYFDIDNDGFTEETIYPWPALETSEGAAGALVSTAPDLSRFINALVKGDIVSEVTLMEMTTPGQYSTRYTGYGLGTEVLRPDLTTTVWGHGGFLPGYRTILWHVPEHQVTITVITNESRSRPDGLTELLLRVSTRGN